MLARAPRAHASKGGRRAPCTAGPSRSPRPRPLSLLSGLRVLTAAAPSPCPLRVLGNSFLCLPWWSSRSFPWSLGWPRLGVRHPGCPTACDLSRQPSSGLSLSFPSLTPRADWHPARSRPSGFCCVIHSPSQNHRSLCCCLCPNLAFQRSDRSKAPVRTGQEEHTSPQLAGFSPLSPIFFLCRRDSPSVSWCSSKLGP